jgi:hypothetical protein
VGSIAQGLRDNGYPTGAHGFLLLMLRGPLIYPDVYGVPPELQALRAGVRAEPRPVRIVGSVRRGSTLVVSVRDVRGYAAPAVVVVHSGRRTQSRAVVVPAGGVAHVDFRLSAHAPAPAARVDVARYPA